MKKIKLDKYEQEIEDNLDVDFLAPSISKKHLALIQKSAKKTPSRKTKERIIFNSC